MTYQLSEEQRKRIEDIAMKVAYQANKGFSRISAKPIPRIIAEGIEEAITELAPSIALQARNEALEEAAQLVENNDGEIFTLSFIDLADRLRAMKEQT